jgi:hypothetical protein
MELHEIWLWYVNEHISELDAKALPVKFTASGTMEKFFDLHPMFTARWDAITAVAFNEAFDDEADGALAECAISDSFAGWEALSAGGWRVLSDRLLYCELVLSVQWAREPETIIDRLPRGLSADRQTKALLLKYLLGHGRTIDRHVLPIKQTNTFPAVPATLTLRRQ